MGVRYVWCLIDKHGSFFTLKYFERKYNLNTKFLTYESLQKVVKVVMASERFDNEIRNPNLHYFLNKIILFNQKGNKVHA